MLFKKLGKGYHGKAIRGGTPGFPRLKGSEADREPAPTQQLGGLGLADIVLCAPGFEPDDDGRELFSHRSFIGGCLIFLLGGTQGRMRPSLLLRRIR